MRDLTTGGELGRGPQAINPGCAGNREKFGRMIVHEVPETRSGEVGTLRTAIFDVDGVLLA
jgi:hypothetical protein